MVTKVPQALIWKYFLKQKTIEITTALVVILAIILVPYILGMAYTHLFHITIDNSRLPPPQPYFNWTIGIIIILFFVLISIIIYWLWLWLKNNWETAIENALEEFKSKRELKQ
jgi:protein-S-isoprenylcysteine O-methyltransferase Ste14